MKTFHNKEVHQVSFLDEHFYTDDNETFYPSVTTILDAYPKGHGFREWLKNNGANSDKILREAGEKGSKVHEAVEIYLKGFEIMWTEDMYTEQEWQMIARFVEFFETYSPRIIAIEKQLINKDYGIGGTLDFVCMINDQVFLIDHKTSNNIYKSHELQLSAYATMWNEQYTDLQIERSGILWLNAKTRGADRQGKKIQGKGWQLKEFDRPCQESFKIFKHCKAIYDEENPDSKPKNLLYPDRFKMKQEENGRN